MKDGKEKRGLSLQITSGIGLVLPLGRAGFILGGALSAASKWDSHGARAMVPQPVLYDHYDPFVSNLSVPGLPGREDFISLYR